MSFSIFSKRSLTSKLAGVALATQLFALSPLTGMAITGKIAVAIFPVIA